MSIVLRAIDRDNWHECVRLALTPEQETFLPSNLFHVAEARFYPERTLLGVYADAQMVGFAMYGLDPDDGTVNCLHFMIDGKEQGTGYGKAALEELLRKICEDYPGQDIWLSLRPREHGGHRTLWKLRFRIRGDRDGDPGRDLHVPARTVGQTPQSARRDAVEHDPV